MHVRRDWHVLPPTTAALVAFLGIGCAADPTIEDGDGATETSTTSADTSTSTPALGSTGEGESSSSAFGETTASVDDTTGTDSEESGGFIPEMDLGDFPAGVCFGVSDIGHLSTVYASAMPTMPECHAEPAPCGGDVVGSWTIDSHCGFESLNNFFANECPSSTMTFVASALTGTQMLGEDGSFSLDGNLTLDFDLQIDTDTCYGVGCGQFGDLLTMQDNNIAAACVDGEDSEDCDCAMTITNTLEREGSFEVEGDMITLTTEAGAADPAPYCVSGEHLTIWEVLNETRPYPDVGCDAPEDCEEVLGDAHDEWFCLQ